MATKYGQADGKDLNTAEFSLSQTWIEAKIPVELNTWVE